MKTGERMIFCCGCEKEVPARLTNGAEIYPHRPDLRNLPFWKCDACQNYVGCHHKTENRTKPLGNIPTKELRKARNHIHAILDPIWKNGHVSRRKVYAELSSRLGWEYHTGNIRTIEEARSVYKIVREMAEQEHNGRIAQIRHRFQKRGIHRGGQREESKVT